jgi:hypothetical protein
MLARLSLPIFELACVVVVVATLVTMGKAARARDARSLLLDYAALAAAGYAGEQSCISLYRFYRYAEEWHAFVGSVPILVPLIWPLVILSARDVAGALLPKGTGRIVQAAVVSAIVTLDASLVEVVAVEAGFWSWSEAGHLGVPLVGILGWGFFAFGASLPRSRVLCMVSGVAVTHALVLASWWGLFRWTLRGDLGSAGFVPVVALSLVATAWALRARRAGRVMAPPVWGPRVLAAGLFFALLATLADAGAALFVHAALVALPYLAATSLSRGRRGGATGVRSRHGDGRRNMPFSARSPQAR